MTFLNDANCAFCAQISTELSLKGEKNSAFCAAEVTTSEPESEAGTVTGSRLHVGPGFALAYAASPSGCASWAERSWARGPPEASKISLVVPAHTNGKVEALAEPSLPAGLAGMRAIVRFSAGGVGLPVLVT